ADPLAVPRRRGRAVGLGGGLVIRGDRLGSRRGRRGGRGPARGPASADARFRARPSRRPARLAALVRLLRRHRPRSFLRPLRASPVHLLPVLMRSVVRFLLFGVALVAGAEALVRALDPIPAVEAYPLLPGRYVKIAVIGESPVAGYGT